MARHLPPLTVIHLQYLDVSCGWVDEPLCIDMDRVCIHHIRENTLIYSGDPYKERLASHFSLLLSPIVLAASPFMAISSWRQDAAERKHGMSIHGIELLRKIEEQLDPMTEGLLRQALKNEWKRKLKLHRPVDVFQACGVLDNVDLTVRHYPAEPGNECRPAEMLDCCWVDDEGDLIGRIGTMGEETHACRVLGTVFSAGAPRLLIPHCRSRRDIGEHDD